MVAWSILWILLSVPVVSAQVKEADVEQTVARLNTTLLEVMQSADVLGFKGRHERLASPLRESFDFEVMTKIAVGRPWNTFDDDQRQGLVQRFAEMSIATFAARFNGYSGETFEIIGQEEGRRNTITVYNQLNRPSDVPVALNFVLRQRSGDTTGIGWRIIDIILDGTFSELARQRAEFAAVLKRGGYDALIQSLDERIEALAREDP